MKSSLLPFNRNLGFIVFSMALLDIKDFISVIILLVSLCGVCKTEDSGDCELFKDDNFKGEPYTSLKDADTIYDFNLVRNEKSVIRSVKVKSGCILLACVEPKLKGKCSEYEKSNEKLSEPSPVVSSSSCKCGNNATELSKLGNNCAVVYNDWHFDGYKQAVEFPGSTGRFGGGKNQIWSAIVKPECKLTAWRNSGTTKGADNKVHSLELEEVVSLVPSLTDGNPYTWYCCHCDQNSEASCKKAVELSQTFEIENDSKNGPESHDTPDFVKYGKKVIGIGRNYRWKNSELTKVLKVPDEPIVFMKPSTSYIVEGQKINLPKSLGTIFYEIELGVVIGKRGKSIKKSDALDYVSGYFLAIDMTAKEFLKKSLNQSKPWEIGKGYDTACPVGHFIPKNLIPNPNDIHLECKINGNVTQAANTSEMIFNVESLISYISKYMTLEPYDVILTGTPDGLGPLNDGDIIEGQLGNITTIRFEAVSLQDDD